jgi:hypothetical protein
MPFYKFLSIFLFSVLAAANSTSPAQQVAEAREHTNIQSNKIPFYLPILQNQFSDVVTAFESALVEQISENAHLKKLELITTDYRHPYQNGIRQGRLGVYFAEPHFASWLVNVHGFETLLHLSGFQQYVIVVKTSDTDLFELNDLATKTICTGSSMDMSFLMVSNSMRHNLQPVKVRQVKEVAKEMKRINQKCDGFSLSEHVFSQITTQAPFEFIRLKQSSEFSNYAYLIHPDVPRETKKNLRELLLSQKMQEIFRPVYRHFTKDPILLKGKSENYPPAQMQPLQAYWRIPEKLP